MSADERLELLELQDHLVVLRLRDHHVAAERRLVETAVLLRGVGRRQRRVELRPGVRLLDHVGRHRAGGVDLGLGEVVDAGGEVAVDQNSAVAGDPALDSIVLRLQRGLLGVGRRRRRRGCRHRVRRRRAAAEGEVRVRLTGEGRDRREDPAMGEVPERTEEVDLLVLRNGRVFVQGDQAAGGVAVRVVELGGHLVGGRLGCGGQVGGDDVCHYVSLVVAIGKVPNIGCLSMFNYSAPCITGVVAGYSPHDTSIGDGSPYRCVVLSSRVIKVQFKLHV